MQLSLLDLNEIHTFRCFVVINNALSAANVCTQYLLDHFHFFHSEAVLSIDMPTITVYEDIDMTAEVCVVVREPIGPYCPIVYPIDFTVDVNDGTASM